jgi:hypothetical protein
VKKAFFIGFLSLLVVAKMIYGFVWHMHFYANQKAIIAQECINKNRPKMNCNGTCYLAKQLKKAEIELEKKKGDQERSLSGMKWLESEVFLSFTSSSYSIFAPSTCSKANLCVPYVNGYHFRYFAAIFHPPCVVDHS